MRDVEPRDREWFLVNEVATGTREQLAVRAWQLGMAPDATQRTQDLAESALDALLQGSSRVEEARETLLEAVAEQTSLTPAEIKTRAHHIVLEGNAALDGKKEPFTKQQIAWRKAIDFANEAEEAAGAHATATTDEEKKKLLAKALERYSMANEQRVTARVTEEIVYSSFFKLHAGAATIKPYKFVTRDGARFLTTSTDTSFYAEADFLYRTAWLEPDSVREDLKGTKFFERIAPQDYEIRLGFINHPKIEGGDTTIDSSTDAAGGDWYTEATLGWVLGTQNISVNPADRNLDVPRGTWNWELLSGFQTDREGFNTTGYYMTGLGTAWSIPVKVDGNKRLSTLAAGIYYGIHEFPAVDDDNGIRSDEAIVPFNRLGSIGVKVDFTVPLTNGLEVVLQGRHFTPVSRNDIADDWSLLVGVSIPIGRIVRDLLK